MLKNLFSILAGYKTALLSILVLAALAGAGVQTLRLAYLDIELQEAAIDAKGLRALLDVQTLGIKALAVKGQQLDAAAARAGVAVKRLAVATEARVKAIEAAPVPASCEQAVQFLVQDAAGGAL